MCTICELESKEDFTVFGHLTSIKPVLAICAGEPWQYMGVYDDESITTSKANFLEFQRLLAECKPVKIDLILIKYVRDGELMFTTLSSFAQEESRSISENITGGQRKRMADVL